MRDRFPAWGDWLIAASGWLVVACSPQQDQRPSETGLPAPPAVVAPTEPQAIVAPDQGAEPACAGHNATVKWTRGPALMTARLCAKDVDCQLGAAMHRYPSQAVYSDSGGRHVERDTCIEITLPIPCDGWQADAYRGLERSPEHGDYGASLVWPPVVGHRWCEPPPTPVPTPSVTPEPSPHPSPTPCPPKDDEHEDHEDEEDGGYLYTGGEKCR